MKHSGYTIRSPRGTLRRLLLFLPLAAVLAAAGILAYLYFNGFFYQRETVNLKTHATIPEITALAKESPTDAATMLAQVRKVLCTDAGTAPFAVSYVEIPGAIKPTCRPKQLAPVYSRPSGGCIAAKIGVSIVGVPCCE